MNDNRQPTKKWITPARVAIALFATILLGQTFPVFDQAFGTNLQAYNSLSAIIVFVLFILYIAMAILAKR